MSPTIIISFLTATLVSVINEGSVTESPLPVSRVDKTELAQARMPDPVRQLDYLLEFDDCDRISDTKVECSFFIQNERSTRRRVSISEMTLFDANGQAVRYSTRAFAGQNHYQMDLPTGVPVKGVGVFEGIPQSTPVVFLEVVIYSFDSDQEEFAAGFQL